MSLPTPAAGDPDRPDQAPDRDTAEAVDTAEARDTSDRADHEPRAPEPHRADHDPDGPSGSAEPDRAELGWAQRRREKIAAEVARNRRGEYTVPTWVLGLALALIVGAWAALVVLS